MTKYDAEIAKCTEYYSKQCAAMEVCRGQISASNYIAANSRMLILDSQGTINRCEVDIPTREEELKQHILKCKHEINKMNTRLKIVMGDIAVMTMILEMTDCEKKLLQTDQLSLLSCEDHVVVVLPASMCAMMPMLRYMSRATPRFVSTAAAIFTALARPCVGFGPARWYASGVRAARDSMAERSAEDLLAQFVRRE